MRNELEVQSSLNALYVEIIGEGSGKDPLVVGAIPNKKMYRVISKTTGNATLISSNLIEKYIEGSLKDAGIAKNDLIEVFKKLDPKFESQERLNDILNRRFVRIHQKIKQELPFVLSKEKLEYSMIFAKQYFLLAFLNEDEKLRIQKMSEKGYYPFPGLIAEEASSPSAFRLEGSKYNFIVKNTVNNMFSLSLGEDSTVILCEHTQSINTAELGKHTYIVPLAYIISFGKEINHGNMYDFLEDLIAYSVDKWVSDYE